MELLALKAAAKETRWLMERTTEETQTILLSKNKNTRQAGISTKGCHHKQTVVL
ncbi:membrane protein FAM159A [Platysternon megacephalum]|uniref:Membrane protein FAM159A n=1 Tax=Platysternon megacephalum TaxID=55544 RepID=A0A4D9ERD3_9SAUR|nr:membrane protein FAM159A [Platysternon megacephalum]